MNIRLTPHQLTTLKALAGEAGLRPGELVTQWVEERLAGSRGAATPTAATGSLAADVKALAARVAALEASARSTATAPAPAASAPSTSADAAPTPKRRGRPPKSATTGETATTTAAPRARRTRTAAPTARRRAAASGTKRVPLHEEIIAVIGERGPMSAADLATAISERGVFAPPRSGKALDAATVNSRVSNPVYRARFRRDGHKIALAETA